MEDPEETAPLLGIAAISPLVRSCQEKLEVIYAQVSRKMDDWRCLTKLELYI